MNTSNFSLPEMEDNLKPEITVIGVGGAGGNAVNNMIISKLEGCNFVVSNTDSQALNQNQASKKIQLGRKITQGLGAGARPNAGSAAAEESIEEIKEHLEDSHMVFITAGMGGGTGTGAAPVIARAAKESGILTVGVVTKPFHFEGTRRMRIAEYGIEQLQQYVDTLIIIPNQNLFRVANEKTTFADAFHMADDVLRNGVRSITDLMMVPGLVNLDFADIRTVMSEMGRAMMGTGEASGEKRALEAAESAISNPLLEDASMKGARSVLINITSGMDMALYEVDEAANRIREEVDSEANIIFGSTFDPKIEGILRVSIVATGIENQDSNNTQNKKISSLNTKDNKPIPYHYEQFTSSENESTDKEKNIDIRDSGKNQYSQIKKDIKHNIVSSLKEGSYQQEKKIQKRFDHADSESIQTVKTKTSVLKDLFTKNKEKDPSVIRKKIDKNEEKDQLSESFLEIPAFLRRKSY